MNDPDADIRIAAFQHLSDALQVEGSPLPWSLVKRGFIARGHRFLLASAAEGIFRPAGMKGLLSVKTVVPKPQGAFGTTTRMRRRFPSAGIRCPMRSRGLIPVTPETFG
jgi:hypothetical protein